MPRDNARQEDPADSVRVHRRCETTTASEAGTAKAQGDEGSQEAKGAMMRRGTRQTLDADGQDWVSMRSRRLLKAFDKPGVGKKTKRRMARRRRREPIPSDYR